MENQSFLPGNRARKLEVVSERNHIKFNYKIIANSYKGSRISALLTNVNVKFLFLKCAKNGVRAFNMNDLNIYEKNL